MVRTVCGKHGVLTTNTSKVRLPYFGCAEVQVKVTFFLTARPGQRKPLSTAQRA